MTRHLKENTEQDGKHFNNSKQGNGVSQPVRMSKRKEVVWLGTTLPTFREHPVPSPPSPTTLPVQQTFSLHPSERHARISPELYSGITFPVWKFGPNLIKIVFMCGTCFTLWTLEYQQSYNNIFGVAGLIILYLEKNHKVLQREV